MKAARCEAYGGPGDLVVRDIPASVVVPGNVDVDVEAAAVNFPGLLFIADTYQVSVPVPFTPGSEFAGRAAAVGEGVSGIAVGDRVMGSTFTGAIAEQVMVAAPAPSPIPQGLSMVDAVGFSSASRSRSSAR